MQTKMLPKVSPPVTEAFERAGEVDKAEALVTADAEVMGGMPCFAGTRVPIEIVLGSLDEGMALAEVRESYPFLTDAHVSAARVYALLHPRRGLPRRFSESSAGGPLREKLVVPPSRG